jgi:hypothetical protein
MCVVCLKCNALVFQRGSCLVRLHTSPTVSKIAAIRPVSKTVEPWFESRLAGHTSPIPHTNIDGVIVQLTEVTKIVRF